MSRDYFLFGVKFVILALHMMQENEFVEQSGSSFVDSDINELRRFELLRSELMELEKRVQRSADQSDDEEVNLAVFAICI